MQIQPVTRRNRLTNEEKGHTILSLQSVVIAQRGEGIMEKNSALNIRISESEHKRFKAFADFQGETMASIILRVIRESMEDWEDAQDAEKIIANNEPTVSWAEVQRKAGF
jgi:predicted DNA-binding protein